MFHKLGHYGKVISLFTRVYASLSNKYKGIQSLAILSDGLSFKINSDPFILMEIIRSTTK